MTKIIEKEKLIKIGKEPVVILPLKKWEEIREYLGEMEEKERCIKAFEESQGKEGITLEQLKKEYKL